MFSSFSTSVCIFRILLTWKGNGIVYRGSSFLSDFAGFCFVFTSLIVLFSLLESGMMIGSEIL